MKPENRVFLRHGDLIETPMRVISIVTGIDVESSGVWAEPIEGNPRAEDINLIPAYTERDIIELACRAPAVPAWFVPDMTKYGFPAGAKTFEVPGGNREHNQFCEDFKRENLIQWPRAYAKMVLEADNLAARRQEPSIPWEQAKKELEAG